MATQKNIDVVEVGKRIYEIRKRLGITQVQLGDLVFYNAGRVSEWETGKRLPPYSTLEQIAKLAIMPLNELLFGKGDVHIDKLVSEFFELDQKERDEFINKVVTRSELEIKERKYKLAEKKRTRIRA